MRDPLASRRLMPTLERPQPVFARGQGSWLWDTDGRAYLDFSQGRGSNSLGHSPSVLVDALRHQAERLIQPGPALHTRATLDLAARLCQATASEQVQLCVDGAEALRGALALARKWGRLHRDGAAGILLAGSAPRGHALPEPGLVQLPYNDLDALEAAIRPDRVALVLAPVDAVDLVPATLDYLQGAARLCQAHGVLLILDETRTGIGRCGALLAEELYGVRADVLLLGSGLGGGLPLAALLARGNACCLEPGDCNEPQGGALVSAAGQAVLDSVLEPDFLVRVRRASDHLRDGLARVARRQGHGPLRGQGLLLGLPLIRQSAPAVVAAGLDEGLLLPPAQANCLRFTPALTISHGNIDEMLKRLARAFARCRVLAAEEV
ncbi:aspartate aminotransferase family protein [Pseudomonas mangiferae]|uniref:Aspartate aminotransferase family protein n=1 Tax=Pseudomonas mangiferae TaxID=2593654 RepID=A0A553H067_9PSED|nr:aminotransferase class III-fold pyridoxal phosphate-dependent enzyme [Pseudomonas mangiferae]TRX75103.1 aspartate aminotransferase family protein [Pseudomonas mangiferae]